MDIFWIVVTVLFIGGIITAWVILELRGQLVSRAEGADPEQAKAMREVQRQIDAGHSHTGLADYNSHL